MRKTLQFLCLHNEKIIILFCAMFVLIPNCPINLKYPYRDSGVFLYSGWRLTNNEIPYLDFWDHKPPIIFFLNALGIILIGHSTWGVWLIELISLLIASYVGYRLIFKLFGYFPAVFSTCLWMIALVFVLDGGNLTTEYILPLQFISLYLFADSLKKTENKNKNIKLLIIGLLGGLAFFLKQTSIAVWISIFIFLFCKLLFTKNKKIFHQIIYFICGLLLVFFILSIYFLWLGAFYEFFDAVFVYNYFYSMQINTFYDSLLNLMNTSFLSKGSLLHLGVLGIPILIILILDKKSNNCRNDTMFFLVILLDIILELLFINISNFSYPHYFITILAGLSISSSALIWVVYEWITKKNISKLIKYCVCGLMIAVLFLLSIRDYKLQLMSYQSHQFNSVVSFISKNTQKKDTVLFWGAETAYNFFSKRVSPSRFNYQYPLLTPGYTNDERIIGFLDDIQNKNPKYIIDCNSTNMPLFVFPNGNNIIDKKIEKIKSDYEAIKTIDNWIVYEKKNHN